MTDFSKKFMEKVQDITSIIDDTLDFGFEFEECFPTTAYFHYTQAGKNYKIKIEVNIQ